jgi:3-hydroxyisobutyrate dehydrogenase
MASRAKRSGETVVGTWSAPPIAADRNLGWASALTTPRPRAGDPESMSDDTAGGPQPRVEVQRIAVLGTGIMGSEFVRNLLTAGFEVQIWNRSRAKTEALIQAGAAYRASPALAAHGADVLITMLSDGTTVDAVMTGPDGALHAVKPGAIWVQMSTVGVKWCDRLAQLGAQQGVAFVDAPVSGSAEAARHRQLVILASGGRPHRARLEPIFGTLGSRTVWLTEVGDGSRLKLVLNNWLAILVEGIAESLALSEGLGLDPRLFLTTIDGGALAARYAMDKAGAMLSGDFALRHAAKDATLAVDAASDHGVQLALTTALLERWRRAIADGHGDDDVAAAVTAAEKARR